ncbi:MAG: ABC transporter ATP-binding protein [Acidobacteria bacterium]|nr:ABC transporter ATP-binding protein [Acidobacteriota bacterium]
MEKALQCRSVKKQFLDFTLGPINLDLEPGMVLGLVGPNGAGKTTFLRCLIGLLRADSGEIAVFGRPNDLNNPEWKLDVGYVGDIPVFWERWPVAKNLQFISQFYPDWSSLKASKLADRFQLPLSKRAKDLSTGNRAKLSLIMALAHSPKLLLFDEPTSGMDPVVRAEVLDVLFEILETGDRTIVYITHILPEISRLVDELVFLDNGQIWLRANKEDLVDHWRKITFRYANRTVPFKSVVSHRREGNDHQIISSDFPVILEQLRKLGAENIQDIHMSIEEITIQILKGGRNVEINQS